jgi:hypothetical protein
MTLTYGEMPTYEEFKEHFKELCPSGIYVVEAYSCSYEYTCKELWDYLLVCVGNWEDDSTNSLTEAEVIMETLDFEWV